MQVYAIIYPWAVMLLSILAATMCLIGGGITARNIATLPIKDSGDSRTGNIFLGFFVFVISCLGSQFCLYIGGKAVGAF